MDPWASVRLKPSFHPLLPEIASLLGRAVSLGDKVTPNTPSPFDGVQSGPLSVPNYLVRMCKYSECSNSVFVRTLILIDRMTKRHRLTSLNVHRMIAVAFVLSVKLTDDEYYGGSYYASISGVALDDLGEMEQIFLKTIEWDICIPESQYKKVTDNLAAATAKKQKQMASTQVPQARQIPQDVPRIPVGPVMKKLPTGRVVYADALQPQRA